MLKGKEESKALNEEPCDFGVSSPVLQGELRCSEWQPGPAGDSRKGTGSSTVVRNRLQGNWRRHVTVRAWLCGSFGCVFWKMGFAGFTFLRLLVLRRCAGDLLEAAKRKTVLGALFSIAPKRHLVGSQENVLS